jgi:hypothetical protein
MAIKMDEKLDIAALVILSNNRINGAAAKS